MKRLLRIRAALLVCLLLAGAAEAQVSLGKRIDRDRVPTSGKIDAARLLRDIEYLASDELEGRSADRPSIAKARAFVERRLRETGVEPVQGITRQEFSFRMRRSEQILEGVNFLGMVRGRKRSDKYIVVTAHYDHVGVSNGEIYNGADDNASGTAALFAVARYFMKKRPDHSLIFVALDAEEKGLQGARHFVANLPVPKNSILLNVNLDMLSRSDKGELYASGTFHYPQFRPALEKAQRKAKVKLLLGHDTPGTGREDWTNQSDHAAFHAAKIPFIYFGVEDHQDYHRPTDDFANIHPEFYVRAVETVIEAVRVLDRETGK